MFIRIFPEVLPRKESKLVKHLLQTLINFWLENQIFKIVCENPQPVTRITIERRFRVFWSIIYFSLRLILTLHKVVMILIVIWTSNILIQQVCLSVSRWQGYTQLTADGPGTSVNKVQMIESNCGPSGWSSCSANVFFLLSFPTYVSSPSFIQWWESMRSCLIGYDGNVLSFPTWRNEPFQEIIDEEFPIVMTFWNGRMSLSFRVLGVVIKGHRCFNAMPCLAGMGYH